MFEDMKKNVHDWEDDEEIKTYLTALLNKQAFGPFRTYLWNGSCSVFNF